MRGAALDITAPITGSLRSVTDTAAGLLSGAGNYWDAARQNAGLRDENRKLQRQAIQARAIFQENAQLKSVLALRENEVATVATGRIVGSSLESARRFAVLTAGSGDGVAVGMPVRSASERIAGLPISCAKTRPSVKWLPHCSRTYGAYPDITWSRPSGDATPWALAMNSAA